MAKKTAFTEVTQKSTATRAERRANAMGIEVVRPEQEEEAAEASPLPGGEVEKAQVPATSSAQVPVAEPNKEELTKRLTVKLTPSVHKKLKRVALERDVNMSDIARDFIEDILKEHE